MDKKTRKAIIEDVAGKLGAEPQWLDALINFETAGTYSPTIKNPNSSARGLIQVIDSTAQGEFNVSDSLRLVQKYPTFRQQMYNVVLPYLKKYAPFPTKQSLYMAVFYPKYRFAPLNKPFPENVKRANTYTIKGKRVTIENPGDYIEFVDNRIREESLHFPFPPAPSLLILAIVIGAGYMIVKNVA